MMDRANGSSDNSDQLLFESNRDNEQCAVVIPGSIDDSVSKAAAIEYESSRDSEEVAVVVPGAIDASVGSESATIPFHLLRTARRRGIDISGLEDRFGIPLDRHVDLLRRLPFEDACELWEELIDRAGDRALPFDMATAPFPEGVAAFVFVTTSRRNVRESLEVLEQRSGLVTTALRFALDVSDRGATVRVRGPALDRIGARAAIEFAVAHVAHDLRCATGERCQPVMRFAHPARIDPTRVGSIVFAAGETAFEIPLADLELPLDVLEGLTQILASRAGEPDLVSRLRNEIALSLAATGDAPLCAIAESLGFTPRTLQRRLPPGVTFHWLLDTAQRDLAVALVRTRPDLAIADIAARIGYSSGRALIRAYRRWTGTTPGEGRRPAPRRTPRSRSR